MGAGGQKPKVPIVCFDHGIRMGLRPVEEWSELLGIKRTTIYNAKYKNSIVCRRYTFADATPEEVQRWREAKSISLMAKAAREQGLSYGELVARRWTEDKRKGEAEKMEEVVEAPVESIPEEQAPKKARLRLTDLVALIDGHVILDVYSRRDGEENWIVSAPSDSPMVSAGMVDGFVEQIRVVAGEKRGLRIYLR